MNTEKSLIIINNEASLLLLLQEYLERFGLTVFTYESIPDLESEMREKGPCAILLDVLMPHVSGIDILKQIKMINQKIPVIMMTGSADDEKRIESLRNGAYAVLTKPFSSMEELYQTINNAMNHYIESLKTEELSIEVEERYRREKMNLLELDFLKSLQHMIGEAENPDTVLKNASMLLKSVLDFEYFGALLLQQDEANIRVYPTLKDNREFLESIASGLLKKLPYFKRDQKQQVVLQGAVEEICFTDNRHKASMVFDLSTANQVYGYAGLFRDTSFDAEEELVFGRFSSHIALALEKIRLFNEIKTLSIHDGMTGVFNHIYVVEEVNSEIERAKRYGGTFSLILLDLDNFKEINDSYGHLAGDFVLKSVAQLIEKTLRTIDIIGRYGGEEFIIIFPQTDLEKARIAGERLRQAVETATFLYEDKMIQLTISLGVTTYEEEKNTRSLIKTADDNLYRAKKGGKNRICYEQ